MLHRQARQEAFLGGNDSLMGWLFGRLRKAIGLAKKMHTFRDRTGFNGAIKEVRPARSVAMTQAKPWPLSSCSSLE
jgi:hypothetical protein